MPFAERPINSLAVADISATLGERVSVSLEISPHLDTPMRRHHEELSMLPALSLLLPFAGALWLRIKTGRPKDK
jgi:hypothetical protein